MKGRWVRSLPWREIAAALPALLLLGVIGNYYADFVSDDAYISFRYAEHLATGRWLEWNPGYVVEGYSNFLWVMLLALPRLAGVPVPTAAMAAAWLSAAATVLVVVLVCRQRSRRASWTLLALAPLPMVLSFPYQWWISMRLETAAFALLLLLAPGMFAAEEEREDPRPWGSALAYLALLMIRPEGPAFLAVPCLYLLWGLRGREDLRRLLRRRWLWLLVWAGGAALYHGWRLAYFGHLFPNTYYAKVSSGALHGGWVYLSRFIAERPLHLVMACAALLLGALGPLRLRLVLATAATLVTVVVLEGGDWMREYRLLMPVVPLLCAALGGGLQHAVGRSGWRVWVSSALGMVLLCAMVQATMGTPLKEWRAALDGQRRGLLINMEGQMTSVSREVGLWLKKNARPGALVAVNHAGAVPFYSGLPSLDMAGLNDLHIARLKGRGRKHTKWDPAYVLRRKPAFVVLNTRVMPSDYKYVRGYWGGETALVDHPEFHRRYQAVPRIWTWKGLALGVRNSPHLAGENHIMVFRRVEGGYRRVGRCLDFERGTFAGWAVTGEAFGRKPTPRKPRPRRPEWEVGRYVADSFRGTDRRVGTLRSEPFTITGDVLEFVACGGADRSKVGVRLLVGGNSVRDATGHEDRRLTARSWDLDGLMGASAQIEIYDQSSGKWGHIVADSFCQFKVSSPESPL